VIYILTLKTIIDKAFKSSKKVYVCFIDFKKAFDTINREALFYKLSQYNIKGTFFDIIQNMYKEVLFAVRSQDGITDFSICRSSNLVYSKNFVSLLLILK
jgi:hypothetical protein